MHSTLVISRYKQQISHANKAHDQKVTAKTPHSIRSPRETALIMSRQKQQTLRVSKVARRGSDCRKSLGKLTLRVEMALKRVRGTGRTCISALPSLLNGMGLPAAQAVQTSSAHVQEKTKRQKLIRDNQVVGSGMIIGSVHQSEIDHSFLRFMIHKLPLYFSFLS